MNTQEKWYEFHFKGVYAGEVLKYVYLKSSQDVVFKKDEEYLMYIELISVLNGTLKGLILKALPVNECRDRS